MARAAKQNEVLFIMIGQIPLGKHGLYISAIGLGCMGMSEFYGPRDDAEAMTTLHRAIDLGVTFWDTADMYGVGHNEIIIGHALRGRRDQVTVATKFGNVRRLDDAYLGVSGHPDYVRSACEASLRRLNIDVIDLYYQHRVDPTVPIEDTVGAMADLVAQGKVRYLGLSEAAPATIRRAAAVHPITALQTEYSLWSRDPEGELFATCRELGVGFVAYSPLGRGFLSGAYKSPDDFAPDDFRRISPRFTGENFQKNLDLVSRLEAWAAQKGCTTSQLALAWVNAQGKKFGVDMVTIPGTKRIRYLEENVGALDIALSDAELAELEAISPHEAVAGTRYPEALMARVNL